MKSVDIYMTVYYFPKFSELFSNSQFVKHFLDGTRDNGEEEDYLRDSSRWGGVGNFLQRSPSSYPNQNFGFLLFSTKIF